MERENKVTKRVGQGWMRQGDTRFTMGMNYKLVIQAMVKEKKSEEKNIKVVNQGHLEIEKIIKSNKLQNRAGEHVEGWPPEKI